MRIREILFHNFRSFRGERRISFVDPLTDAVRPVTVIAGTNGTGKTIILDAIEVLLAFVLEGGNPGELIYETDAAGLVCITLEFDPVELLQTDDRPPLAGGESTILQVAVGNWDLLPDSIQPGGPRFFGRLYRKEDREPGATPSHARTILANKLFAAVQSMYRGRTELHGGLIYFPHNRHFGATQGGVIEPLPEERQWLSRFSPADQWQGSLEQLWVWQNYLDLEQGVSNHLKPFVATVENVLGKDRTITIQKGHALVSTPWDGKDGARPRVRLDQLPSGEQQCLLLFGELARRRRPGGVIAIDEPEISLHPTLQRLVVHRLREFAREWDSQVILATHSLEVLRAVHESERINLDQLDSILAPQETP